MELLQVKERINFESKYNGSDSVTLCLNKKHFHDYKKSVHYLYNSKGFRDEEWPNDIYNKIWCVGDSFTLGLGQPYEEIWPKLLEKKLGERCINISEDGCSNDLMAARIEDIKKYNPKYIVVMWSYFWRRWTGNRNVNYDVTKRELPKDDLINFLKNLKLANLNSPCGILNFVIPDCMIETASSWKTILVGKNKKNINKLITQYDPLNHYPIVNEVEQLDYARDGRHYDILTCEKIVEEILMKFNKL